MIKVFETENKCIKLLSIMMCVLMLFTISCSFLVQPAHANEIIVAGGAVAAVGVAALLASMGIISQNTANVTTNIISPLVKDLKAANLLSPVGMLPYYAINGITYTTVSIVNYVKNWLYNHNFYNLPTTDTYYTANGTTYDSSHFLDISTFLTYCVNNGLQSLAAQYALDNYTLSNYSCAIEVPGNGVFLLDGVTSVCLSSNGNIVLRGTSALSYLQIIYYASTKTYRFNTSSASSGYITMLFSGDCPIASVGDPAQTDVNYAQVPNEDKDAQDTIYDWGDNELPVTDAKITLPDDTVVDAVDDNDDAITDTLLPQTFEDAIDDALALPQETAITGTTTSTAVDTEVDNTDVDVQALSGDITLLGLMETRFPWCIPWDLTASIRALSADAQAPCFTVDLFKDVTWDGLDLSNTSFTIDFSVFAKIALACRWMMTIMFCGNLALITKKMIWS